MDHTLCVECDKNIYVKSAAIDLEFLKHDVVDCWVHSVDVEVEGGRRYLVDVGDLTADMTTMPAFNTYKENWERALLDNPFIFNWFDFRICDIWCRDYVRLARNILAEQLSFWDHAGISNPRSLEVFKRFKKFWASIERLAYYVEREYDGDGQTYLYPDSRPLPVNI